METNFSIYSKKKEDKETMYWIATIYGFRYSSRSQAKRAANRALQNTIDRAKEYGIEREYFLIEEKV